MLETEKEKKALLSGCTVARAPNSWSVKAEQSSGVEPASAAWMLQTLSVKRVQSQIAKPNREEEESDAQSMTNEKISPYGESGLSLARSKPRE